MKKIIALILVIVTVFCLSGCNAAFDEIADIVDNATNGGKDNEKPAHYGNDDILKLTRCSYTDVFAGSSKSTPVDLKYEEIMLSDECAKMYPELSVALKNSMGIRSKNSKNIYDDLVDVAKSYLDPIDGMRYFSESTISVQRADKHLLSYVHNSGSYSGGAHGMYYISGETFDTKTGKKLALSDITSDKAGLGNVIYNHLMRDYAQEMFQGSDPKAYILENLDKTQWVMDYSGLTFLYNQYELASFASGVLTASIPFSEIPGLLCPQYSEVPQKYAIELGGGTDRYDLDGDGVPEEIFTYCDDYSGGAYVGVGEDQTKIDDIAYDGKFVLVHMGSGENYLYSNITYGSDDEAIIINTINPGGMSEISRVYEGLRSEYLESAMGSLEYVFTDPDCVEIGCNLQTLSTVYGHKKAYVDSYGKLVNLPGQDLYTVSDAYPLILTLKKSINAKVIDENTGKEKESISLNPGDELVYYRTDNKRIADLKTMDGTVVRVEIDKAGSVYGNIDGVSIDQIFDGIIFAG